MEDLKLISYKAKDKRGVWVYGYPVYDSIVNIYSIVCDGAKIEIDVDTLSACFGKKDIEGTYMYENDKIEFLFDGTKKESIITFDRYGGFKVAFTSFNRVYVFRLNEIMESDRRFKVVGNKYDK